jgi:hypothetical protein
MTTYFRTSFSLPRGLAVRRLRLLLLRDDGAVVYLNGREVRRDNMPAGPIRYEMPSSAQATSEEEQRFIESEVDPSALVDGVNVVAAEVHQASATSSDISFDLELVAVSAGK